jgi:hypothetical protein
MLAREGHGNCSSAHRVQDPRVYEWKGVTCLRLLYHIAGDLGSVYLSILAEWGTCSNGRFLHSVGHGCLDHDD